MSLISAELERQGIATGCVMLLREVAEKMRTPRALCVPFAHGFPLGRAHDAGEQKRVMVAALRMLSREAPLMYDYAAGGDAGGPAGGDAGAPGS